MRLTGLIVVLLLMSGCARATVSEPESTSAGPLTSITSTAPSSSARTTAPSTTKPAGVPADGAPISEVISWIEAGRPADAAGYHVATRDGTTTGLGEDVAFRVPGTDRRATVCMTDRARRSDALSCLVDLAKPPAAPTEIYGQWKGGWVDFDGETVQVGSAHGDPGPFHNGDGPDLATGSTLSFGDFRCRAQGSEVFCVNYAHRTAVRLSTAGIATFGCLHPVPQAEGAGERFSC
ncbi:hypothetical protein MU0083_001952 [[Mycobacterium] kokjensenii]|uniref:LppI n=1 Tax=[Mycobacterium] kokjensenii TaxID=3064287 RepID=A0ABM9LG86_9MYCO|nr:hypothetical protein [Mycolicibacter sp. MU0083]CAJ1498535.1 hypothetical protein MU0083_001952 [Mycolicibacter sp. MU0083]